MNGIQPKERWKYREIESKTWSEQVKKKYVTKKTKWTSSPRESINNEESDSYGECKSNW